MKRDRKPRPLWKDLMLIPVQLVLDIVLLYAGAYLDTKIVSPEATGHPTFALTIVFAALACIMSAAVLLYVLIRAVRVMIRKR